MHRQAQSVFVLVKSGKTGIWNISQNQLSNVNLTNLSHNLLEMACTRLGVNITEAVLNPRAVNFSNPMVSGVIATFYTHYVVTEKKTIPSAENVTEQTIFWLSKYKMNDTAITLSHFTECVQKLKGMVYIFKST